MKIFNFVCPSNTIWMQFLKHLKDIANQYVTSVLPGSNSELSNNMKQTINTFYYRILHLARQCQFENINECLIDAIVYGCKSKKAQDKLLQMPIRMMLEECLLFVDIMRVFSGMLIQLGQLVNSSNGWSCKAMPKTKIQE